MVQIYRTRNSAHREKVLCHARKMEERENFRGATSGSYPVKTIAKNFVSLITYPHSDSKHFEKRPRPSEDIFFVKIFCECGKIYDTPDSSR